MRRGWIAAAAVAVFLGAAVSAAPAGEDAAADVARQCVTCHRTVTPLQVKDWAASKHAGQGVTCADCHGAGHRTVDDVAKVSLPTYETCATCHDEQVTQFKRGKHALAWAAMKAMPAAHYQPMELIDGMKGCGGCHKIGIKTEADLAELKKEKMTYGNASCDACHTRHSFSAAEARQPEACATCHMGFDHPQWEMWSTSKHGVRYLLRRQGIGPSEAAAPACQTCHLPNGTHENRTAWGFLAVRLPMPDEPKWAEDRATILKALGVLDPEGKPTERLPVVKGADVARLTQEAWEAERSRMKRTCSLCHSGSFADGELKKADGMIRRADGLMAEAIRIVAGLYEDGVIPKPYEAKYAYPDLLTFNEAGTEIEGRLFQMFLKHRMRAFQGSFHANPDYAFWYGWSEMRADLTAIREEAKRMRAAAAQPD
ncbi:MAG: cytochrome C [Planctomycetes bacterium]|nr:cytochrome C [Planctomycetota bacterium]